MAKTQSRKQIDVHPQVSGDKKALRVSGSGVIRRREPTNPHTAGKHPNMVWDFSEQQKFWPDGKPNSLIEATQQHNISDYKTINKSGRPYALGVQMGGSPDDAGHAFGQGPRAKILK